jgi:hypothetical protein
MKNRTPLLQKLISTTLFSSALFLGALSFAPNAFAVKFANQFTEFELPPGWNCNLEVAEWVCQSADPAKKKEAIIVLAAKLKGDQDSLDQYLSYLKSTKTFTSVSGKTMKSEPRYAKTVNLNGNPWVDALHLESEIPGFYTRYFATVKDDIGVLVTYSVAKAKYAEYNKDFDNMVSTLKVFRKAGGINVAPQSADLLKTQIPTTISADGGVFPGVNPQGGAEVATTPKPAEKTDDLVLYGIIGAAAVAFIIFKKKKR